MDSINHPPHYNQGKIEVIEFIEDQQLGYHLGNAVKYISRAGKKNPEKIVEDLEKAIWYIRRKIELQNPAPRRPNDMAEPEQLNFEWLSKLDHSAKVPPLYKELLDNDAKHTLKKGF